MATQTLQAAPKALPAADADAIARRRSALLLISNLGLGGAERQMFYLAVGLRERGWEIVIASMTPVLAPSFAETLDSTGIRFVVLQQGEEPRLGALVRAVRSLVGLVREVRPAVLIGFMPHGAVLARVVGRLAGVPKVVTSLRNIRSTRPWHDRVLRLTRRLDAASVTNSAAAAEAQVRDRVTTPDRSVLIPNGFDMSRVSQPRDRSALGQGREFRWLNVAVVRHEKDHATLLRAAKMLSLERRFRLVVAGQGPLLEPMKALAAELGIADRVDFLGQRSEVADLIAEADAFVLSSLWEGLPNVLIEAHAGALPAVATDVGGCSEVVDDGTSGLLVPAGDAAALAAAMQRIMDLPAEARERMGAAGREQVLTRFSMERMVSRWEEVIS